MAEPTRGESGSGFVQTYETTRGRWYRLELLTFTIVSDATAGVHTVRVRLTDPALGTIALLPDLNEAGPSMTIRYTYGVGLSASACTITDGMTVEDALPDTILRPETLITIEPVDSTGAEIPGDAVGNVILFLQSAPASGDEADREPPEPLLVAVGASV